MRLFVGWVVVAVLQNVFDFLVNVVLLRSQYAQVDPKIFHEGVHWIKPVIANALLALFFVYLYERVATAFPGLAGAITYGFLVGLLTYVPSNLMVLYYMKFPVAIPWTWMVGGIIIFLINGLAVGLVWQYVKLKAA